MNFDPDDPRLTAYALGELDDISRAYMEAELARNPEAARTVEEIRAAASMLVAELSLEQGDGLGDERLDGLIAQSLQLMGEDASHEFSESADADEHDHAGKTPLYHVLTHPAHQRRDSRRLLAIAGIAAALLIALGVIATLLTNHPRETLVQTQPTPDREVVPFVVFPGNSQSSGHDATANALVPDGSSAGDASVDGVFLDARAHPASGFPMAVSTASYADVRNAITAGRLPARGSVRIEGMVNAFAYHYPAPAGQAAFAADLEVAACPWNAAHRLVRIGVKARESGGGEHAPAARDVTARVEFNPAEVASYRLIGYERREGQSSAAGSNVVPGQAVTAFYEIVPAARPTTSPSDAAQRQMLALTLRYRLPVAADFMSQQFAAIDAGHALPQATPDFQFASAVADFGLILRDFAPHAPADLDAVLSLASAARGPDNDGARAAFLDLVRKARDLKRA